MTLTTQLAFTPLPSVALAHILAFPAFLPVIVPLFDTVHTDFLLDFHLSFLFEAVSPDTIAVSFSFFPTPTSAVSGSVIVVTFSMTVIIEYAIRSPSSDTHLIRVAPPLIPLISPSSFTVHMLGSSLVQVTSLSEALPGVMVAVSSKTSPTSMDAESGETVSPVTCCDTVTLQYADDPPSVLANITQLPFPLAVILPPAETSAIFLLLLS